MLQFISLATKDVLTQVCDVILLSFSVKRLALKYKKQVNGESALHRSVSFALSLWVSKTENIGQHSQEAIDLQRGRESN